MTPYYGVECNLCGIVIVLGKRADRRGKEITFYVAPLKPIPCPECGGSYLYGTDDLFGIEAEESISQFPAKTTALKPKR
jgi:hypothetical protein